MSKTSVPTDSAMAEKVWEQSTREVGNFILSRRVGIEQSAVKKLRFIDDLSESGVSRAFSYRNEIRLGSVDEIAAVAKFRLVAADGSEHVVKIHPALHCTAHETSGCKGKPWICRVPTNNLGFARIRCGRVPLHWYLQLGSVMNAQGRGKFAAHGIGAYSTLDLIGWDWAQDERKNRRFESEFDRAWGICRISNKPDRMHALDLEVSGILASGLCLRSAATSLSGKLLFAEAHSVALIVWACGPEA
eukprot:4546084-Amphidinium_carterae.3